MSTLEQLRKYTTIVADTGDFGAIKKFAPQDGTTNPSHILDAAKQPQFKAILATAAKYGKEKADDIEAQIEQALLRLLVSFGTAILELIPGRVSTQVDAIYTFDTDKIVKMACDLVALYEEFGVPKSRVLIKIASNWEGFEACRILEAQGIHCNLTLLFSVAQAKAAAEAGATVISPYVGRTMDWWQKEYPGVDYTGPKDPGVKVVREIFEYYAAHDIKTEIMAASLRSIDECVHLAGVHLMTIHIQVLEELMKSDTPVRHQLVKEKVPAMEKPEPYGENRARFQLELFNDRAATEKLSDCLRNFLRDGDLLKRMLRDAIMAA